MVETSKDSKTEVDLEGLISGCLNLTSKWKDTDFSHVHYRGFQDWTQNRGFIYYEHPQTSSGSIVTQLNHIGVLAVASPQFIVDFGQKIEDSKYGFRLGCKDHIYTPEETVTIFIGAVLARAEYMQRHGENIIKELYALSSISGHLKGKGIDVLGFLKENYAHLLPHKQESPKSSVSKTYSMPPKQTHQRMTPYNITNS